LNLLKRDITDGDKIEILKLLETFMLRRHICEYRTGELDDIFSKLVEVKNENIIINIKENLSKQLPKDEEFEDKLTLFSFKRTIDRAKYMLEQFEYRLIGDQGEYVINSGDEVHLEHIIPQTIDTKKAKKEFGDWITYLGKDATDKHKDYVDCIGNYTLLGQVLNIRASNNPFLAKKKEYKKSTIHLTKEIAQKFSSFRFREVNKRSKEFASLAPKIWGFE